MTREILHIDANSAYLSWTAVHLLENGYPLDIRTVPAVISGNPRKRHGIILAKSIPSKAFGIKTGESLYEALSKCPGLMIFPPDYNLYMKCSDSLHDILAKYTPLTERYSVDECFMDYSGSGYKFGPPLELAHRIKEEIKKELGFTVNIGVSSNKLLAKMGSGLKKPDKVHSLYPEEMEEKLWPLPVEDLFMVGRATARKLKRINISTIGDLARADPLHMRALLKSHGTLVWNYANGIDNSPVLPNNFIIQKGIGNSTTTAFDVETQDEACKVLLALTEKVGMRLRRSGCRASLVAIALRSYDFTGYTHQVQLNDYIDSTGEIYEYACRLLEQCWKGEPLRHMGVSVSNFADRNSCEQLSIFRTRLAEKNRRADRAVDEIRQKYGDESIIRGVFANTDYKPIQGGTHDGEYIMMGGYRS